MDHPRAGEQQTIERALAGDRNALEEILLRRYDWLRSIVHQAMPGGVRGAAEEVDDVLQDAFVRILRSFATFNAIGGEASLFQWIKTIVLNVARDSVRQQRRSREIMQDQAPFTQYGDEEVSDLIAELAVDHQSAQANAQKNELIKAFRIVLSGLEPTYQQVIELLYFQHHSVEQTAEVMQTTPAAVRGYRGRARDKIRAGLIRLSNFV